MSLLGALLVVFFAALMTLQLAIAVGLLQRLPRWRGLAALLPPLAPLAVYWALKEKMYIRSGLWGSSLLGYAIAAFAAYR
jgi:hypothetical protein